MVGTRYFANNWGGVGETDDVTLTDCDRGVIAEGAVGQ